MISPKKLIKIARKWQKMAAIGRRRIALPRTRDSGDAANCNILSNKGHFVVYTTDQKWFVVPLDYLQNDIFREIFKLAEEEYGPAVDGPITVPCDAAFMEYAISLIQRHTAKNLEKAFLMSLTAGCCLSSSYTQLGQHNQTLLISSF